MATVSATLRVNSDKASIDAALEGLTRLNMVQLRAHGAQGRPVPPLMRAGVRWRRDKGETWDTIDIVRQRGYGDCEDLAAWLAAELRLKGIAAKAVVKRSRTPGVAWHAVVQLPSGAISDPSARLGMV